MMEMFAATCQLDVSWLDLVRTFDMIKQRVVNKQIIVGVFHALCKGVIHRPLLI